MKVAYFDCIAGISGDMTLGALLDAGLPLDVLKSELAKLPIGDFQVEVRTIHKGPIAAKSVTVKVSGQNVGALPAAEPSPSPHSRSLAEILAILEESALSPSVKEKAARIFSRLAAAEARVHGVAVEDVHFHELGGVDTIVDVVGAVAGLELLGVEKVYASPIPLARGFVECAHGKLPLPAPATIELLKGVPVKGVDVEAELVTPTGAALITTLAADFGPIPPMRIEATGYGAGRAELPFPNVLRIIIGESGESRIMNLEADQVVLMETNLDDTTPEVCGYLMERLFAEGALDVFFTPIQMKKNRPGTKVSVLSPPEKVPALLEAIFAETTTLGVRMALMERRKLPRRMVTVSTPYGPVRVKVGLGKDGSVRVASPEYEDCRRIAEEKGVPLRTVYEAAARAYGERRKATEDAEK